MGKRPDGSSEKRKVVSFTRDAADRIARAVRSHEAGARDGEPLRSYPRLTANPSAKNIRVGKVSYTWEVGTCASVTLWERTGTSCEPSERTPTETIENVANLSRSVPGGSWVVIGRATDGKWYLIEAADGGRVGVGKVDSDWAIGTCATVTLWGRAGTSCEPTAKSPAETVQNVANLSHDVPAGSWVVIDKAADGQWYLVESGIGGSCRKTIGGEDITKWSGWDGTKEQLLGHDANGCLRWFDVEQCNNY